MGIKEFISMTSYGSDPFKREDWKKQFRYSKDFPLLEKHISTGEILIITGVGYVVSWNEPHDCGCEYCEHENEERERFFTKKEDALKYSEELETSYEDNQDIEILSDRFYIKAVKQNNNIGGLFQ